MKFPTIFSMALQVNPMYISDNPIVSIKDSRLGVT